MEHPYQKYICKTCGLIYDEELGDPDSGLAPGTRFEDIPDDWYCPLCLVGKDDFVLINEQAQQSSDGATRRRKVGNTADVLIIGSGYAGWHLAETLRQQNSEASITIITADDGSVYPKPALSMALSQNRTPNDLTEASSDQKATQLNIGVKTKTKVMSVNTKRKKVTTTTGSFQYDKLVFATGAKALTPKLSGNAAHEVMTINDLNSYKKFHKKLAKDQSITLIGGGLIATELAEDLTSFGAKVTMIVRGAHLMSQILPQQIACELEDKLKQRGVDIIFNSEATTINASAEGDYQILTDQGESLSTNLVVSAIGLQANTALAKKAKVETNLGICINEYCQTSDPDVFAIGDCAERSGSIQAYLEPIRRQSKAIASYLYGDKSETFELIPTLIKTKTPSLSIMLSPPLKATHGSWEVNMNAGANQKLLYQTNEEVEGFALSGEFVTGANQLYQELFAS